MMAWKCIVKGHTVHIPPSFGLCFTRIPTPESCSTRTRSTSIFIAIRFFGISSNTIPSSNGSMKPNMDASVGMTISTAYFNSV